MGKKKDSIALQSKIDFYNTISSILHETGNAFYTSAGPESVDRRNFTFIAALTIDHLEPLRKKLSGNLNVMEIETAHYKGLYLEASPELLGLLIAPGKNIDLLSPEFLSLTQNMKVVYELNAFGKKYNLKNLTVIDEASWTALWGAIKLLISRLMNIPAGRLDSIEYENSHREFVKNYLQFKNSREKYHFDSLENFNHIENFSWLYYLEIKIISEFVRKENITVYDTGTSYGHLPLLLSSLPKEDLMGLDISRILASDIQFPGLKFTNDILKHDKSYKPIEFFTLDLIKNLAGVPEADVVIVNDVLEHLPDDEASFSALEALWNKTGELLIAHVPYEDTPNPAWGHRITFDEKKVRGWAGRLPGAHFLSDVYPYDQYHSMADAGYFLLVKRSGEQTARVDFYNRIRGLLDQLKFKIHINTGWLHSENLKYSVLGALNISGFESLKEALTHRGFPVSDMDMPHYRAIYFEESPENTGLFLSPKSGFVSLEQDVLNARRDTCLMNELKIAGNNSIISNLAGLDIETCTLLWQKDKCVIAEAEGMTIEQVYSVYYENNHKEYLRHYKNFMDNKKLYEYEPEKYDYLEACCWVYCWEITIMAELFGGREVSIHDAGTDAAHFPLLLSKLSRDELMGLNASCISASDRALSDLQYTEAVIKQGAPGRPVQFLKTDWIKNTDPIPASDIITVNSVLQNQPDEDAAFDLFKKLWDKAGRLLMVYVPMEQEGRSSLSFSKKKLREWAGKLSGARLISDRYFAGRAPLTTYGFLIAEKVRNA